MSFHPILRLSLALLVAGWAGLAQAEPGYLVEDVPAQATGANTVEARDAALLKGQRDALQTLFDRLVQGDRGRVPAVTDQLVFQTMQGFEVKDERTTGSTYSARLTVEFRRAAIDRILGGQGVPTVVEPEKPALLLPLLIRADGTAVLWSEDNGWQVAWANRRPAGDSQRLVVPLGDLQDIQQLSVDIVSAGDVAAMESMARSYDCEGVYIATARQTAAEGVPALVVEVAKPGESPLYTGDFQAEPTGDYTVAFETAATAAGSAIQEAFRRQNAVPAGPPQHLEATARFRDLKTWRTVRQTLENTAAIQRLTVKRLGVGSADLAIDYRGDPATLSRMLADRGLALVPSGGGWELSVGRAPGGMSGGLPSEAPSGYGLQKRGATQPGYDGYPGQGRSGGYPPGAYDPPGNRLPAEPGYGDPSDGPYYGGPVGEPYYGVPGSAPEPYYGGPPGYPGWP